MAKFKSPRRGFGPAASGAEQAENASGQHRRVRASKPFNPDDSERATLSAMRSLARVDQSRQELSSKLLMKGFTPAVVESVLTELTRAGWLNDQRALGALLDRSHARKLGPLRIKAHSRQKGFDPDQAKEKLAATIEQSASTESVFWEHQAVDALTRRFKAKPLLDQKSIQQALRFLAQRGFTFSHSKSALKRYQLECGDAPVTVDDDGRVLE